MQSTHRACVCMRVSVRACACSRVPEAPGRRGRILTPQFIVVAAALRLSAAVAPVTEVALVVGTPAHQPALHVHQHDKPSHTAAQTWRQKTVTPVGPRAHCEKSAELCVNPFHVIKFTVMRLKLNQHDEEHDLIVLS